MHNKLMIGKKTIKIKHVFWGDIQPVFFVVENNVNELFVCSLYDDRCGMNWIICPTTLRLLSQMIHNLITIRELFDYSQNVGLTYKVSLKNNNYEVEKIPYRKINCDDLPTAGYYFDGDVDDIVGFLKAFSLDECYVDARYCRKSLAHYKKRALKECLVHKRRGWLNYRERIFKQKRGLLA